MEAPHRPSVSGENCREAISPELAPGPPRLAEAQENRSYHLRRDRSRPPRRLRPLAYQTPWLPGTPVQTLPPCLAVRRHPRARNKRRVRVVTVLRRNAHDPQCFKSTASCRRRGNRRPCRRLRGKHRESNSAVPRAREVGHRRPYSAHFSPTPYAEHHETFRETRRQRLCGRICCEAQNFRIHRPR